MLYLAVFSLWSESVFFCFTVCPANPVSQLIIFLHYKQGICPDSWCICTIESSSSNNSSHTDHNRAEQVVMLLLRFVPPAIRHLIIKDYDEGDCCKCTCSANATYDCGLNIFACINPDAWCVDDDDVTAEKANCSPEFSGDAYCDLENNNEECGTCCVIVEESYLLDFSIYVFTICTIADVQIWCDVGYCYRCVDYVCFAAYFVIVTVFVPHIEILDAYVCWWIMRSFALRYKKLLSSFRAEIGEEGKQTAKTHRHCCVILEG